MKRCSASRPTRYIAGVLPLPRLSDEAVIQIHDFLHHVLDVFEARYNEQIDRFYDDLCESCRDYGDPDPDPDPMDMDMDDPAI